MASLNKILGENAKKHVLLVQTIIGALVVMAIIVGATMWMSAGATVVADRAVDKVGGFYLQELAGHRSQVIAGSLRTHFDQIRRAMDLMATESISTQDELRAFIAKIEQLYDLEQFAIVDQDDIVYARYATYMGGSRYDFLSDGSLANNQVVSSTSLYGAKKEVCLAIPVSDLTVANKPLKACFIQLDINNIVEALSTEELDTGTSFCIYHRNGDNLTQLDFGPIDKNQNLFTAMRNDITEAELATLQANFTNGIAGDLVFTYEGNKETLFYEPIPNSNWVLTVLVADHLIQDQIRGVGDEMVSRSTALIGISGVVLMGFFGAMVHLIRKRSKAEIEKERQHSEDASKRAQKTEQELGTVKEVAYKDALTGVKSRYAFAREELAVDEAIQMGEMEPIAIVLCDINNLKETNDLRGHAAGDELIKAACRIICMQYDHSPVFRIGGDEFVVLLRGYDYAHRNELEEAFNTQIEEHLAQGKVVVAMGMSELTPGDEHLHDVFMRADKLMYARKAQLKSMKA